MPVLGVVGCIWLLGSRISPSGGAERAHQSLGAVVGDLVALGLLISVARLLPRHSGTSDEDKAWRLILSGVTLIAGAVLVAHSITILDRPGSGSPDEVADLVFSVGSLAACAPLYLGLVHWNRIRTGSSDPGEMLNGFGSFFVTVAFGNLLVPASAHQLTGLPQLQVQASVGGCAAIVILFGTATTVALVGGLLRDPRIWLVVGSIGLVGAGQVLALFVGGARTPSPALWLFMAAVMALCAQLAPFVGRDNNLNHQATVIGAITVIIGGVTVVLLNGALLPDQRRLTSCFAATGVLVVSLRLLRVIHDLAELALIRQEALTDDLTGLPNRRALLSAIEIGLQSEVSASLLILDLERFKTINDRFGHTTGDLLLQHLATTLAAHLPEGAMLARLGGDEFAVLLEESDTSVALGIAHTLAHATVPLEDRGGQVIPVSVNIGVATAGFAGADSGELLRRADTALEEAKTTGAQVCEYNRALDTAKHERLGLIEDLHVTLEGLPPQEEQIVVYYQPQLDAATDLVVGAEALVRWSHPHLGLLAPDTFIDIAEQNGLMPALTACVMRQATVQATRWRAAGHHLRISVNISATSLNDPALLLLIDEVLAHGLEPGDLVLELTETSLMTNPEQCLVAMKRLSARGVGVSIDDYGTGYSSLSYLNDLPATELKIDRSFTSRIVSDPRTAAIVAGTVELAHRLGIRLVAEGIEDEATLKAMKALGCDETQGYLHSRPLPAELFLEWLQERTADRVEAGQADHTDSRRKVP